MKQVAREERGIIIFRRKSEETRRSRERIFSKKGCICKTTRTITRLAVLFRWHYVPKKPRRVHFGRQNTVSWIIKFCKKEMANIDTMSVDELKREVFCLREEVEEKDELVKQADIAAKMIIDEHFEALEACMKEISFLKGEVDKQSKALAKIREFLAVESTANAVQGKRARTHFWMMRTFRAMEYAAAGHTPTWDKAKAEVAAEREKLASATPPKMSWRHMTLNDIKTLDKGESIVHETKGRAKWISFKEESLELKFEDGSVSTHPAGTLYVKRAIKE